MRKLGVLHPDNIVVTGRSKHARICRVPRDGIHTARKVSLQGLDKTPVFLVPYIDT